jgi:hypothetical protein
LVVRRRAHMEHTERRQSPHRAVMLVASPSERGWLRRPRSPVRSLRRVAMYWRCYGGLASGLMQSVKHQVTSFLAAGARSVNATPKSCPVMIVLWERM